MAQKIDIDKTYENFVPFMTQQEEYFLSNQPTSIRTCYINAMIDSIVHKKMQ